LELKTGRQDYGLALASWETRAWFSF